MYTRNHSEPKSVKLPEHYSGCAFCEDGERSAPPPPKEEEHAAPSSRQADAPCDNAPMRDGDLTLLLGLCFLLFHESGSRDLLLCLAVLLFCGDGPDFTHLFEKSLAF